MREDGAAVLRTMIRTLVIPLCGIVHGKEGVQQSIVAYANWIVGQLHNFRMTGAVCTYIAIGWVLKASTLIANRRLQHTGNLIEPRFDTPEAPCTKRCYLHCFAAMPGMSRDTRIVMPEPFVCHPQRHEKTVMLR